MKVACRLPHSDYEIITLGHGGGGRLSQQLISGVLLPKLNNDYLQELHDGAVFPIADPVRLAFTTDSFVVSPPFFPGGDIGLLSVYGTANDLAMCGARPLFLSLALIIEEGFSIHGLEQILSSIRTACDLLELQVVTGDTKVVERGKGDGIFINTTGLGAVLDGIEISPRRIRAGDQILLSGSLAEHGVSIMSLREGLKFDSPLLSDTSALWPLVEAVLRRGGQGIHSMRDATRGGLASALNEMALSARVGIVIDENALPVREEVQGACEILGLDPLYIANEGKFVSLVSPECSEQVLSAMREHPLGRDACRIGEVVAGHPGVVVARNGFGATRVIDMISGEQLPRIC
ncbi:MAG: hydrogenase expression/formation protein HypE [Acidobacteria bacterium]|nr:hydrogenase expression/formation protein HypE [Acidobacteriota bacterium]